MTTKKDCDNGITIGLDCTLFTDYVCASLSKAEITFKKVVYHGKYWIKIHAQFFYTIFSEDKDTYSIVQGDKGMKIPKNMVDSFVIMDA